MEHILSHPSSIFWDDFLGGTFQNQSVAGNVNQQIKKESLTELYKFCGMLQ